ncbi:MAG: thiamine diphosphokinase [Roseburia sp.]|nr:thiamine diphosphokinase [Roseburia sp.]
MHRKILIISGGTITDDFAKEWIGQYQPDYIIVADSGMEFMRRAGYVPDMIIGDFDSVGSDTLSFFREQPGICWKELNPVKDDTDTEFAIRQAIDLGAKEITVLGATGSRLDHVLGNVALLGIGLQENVDIQLVDAHNRIRMTGKSVKLRKAEQFGSFISLIPYTAEVKPLWLKGFKYPLENFTMGRFSSLGISNEIIEEEAEILFEEGILLVIESKD